MKKNLLSASFFAVALLISGNVKSQESEDLLPYSSLINLSDYETGLNNIVLPALDMNQILLEDEQREKRGEFERIAVALPVTLNLNNSGVWSYLPNGDKIWRCKITCEGALATILFFNDFYIPAGGRVHVYNEDQSDIIGAFTSNNNHESGIFSTDNVKGETCIIEYYEPVSQSGKGHIGISEVGNVYRDVHPDPIQESVLRIDESDPCEVDVACSEGNGWTDQINATVRIRVKVGSSFGFCSGTVVNNTAQDCTPYVLTAWHCGEGASTSDFTGWIIYFNYQKSGCGTGTASTVNRTGVTMRANSNDGGGNSGSDFLLVELVTAIPTSYNPYFSGWDATAYTGTSLSVDGVSIHHPSGDCKKISTYTNSVVSTQWGSASGSHWRIVWSATANGHGVTEGGSSGSGIFRADNKYIWGTLTGGSSFCTATSSPDLYGKLSYHWTSNGTATNRQLKPWLDPTNSGVTTLAGTYYPCVNSVAENELGNLLTIYPNPSNGMINVSISNENVDLLTVEVYNMMGQLVHSGKIPSSFTNYHIDLSDQADGVYLISVNSPVASITKKIILEK